MVVVSRRERHELVLVAILFFCFLVVPVCGSAAFAAEKESEPLFAVKEGWGWPVIVIPPPSGWESKAGEAIKLAMRAAEREISFQRSGIRGREVIFLFANLKKAAEIPERIDVWRRMRAAVIVNFGGSESDAVLKRLCASNGPAVIFSGGENQKILDPASGEPFPYLFALDLPYYARANALAGAAEALQPQAKVAIISDILSERIAKGAKLNESLLKAKNIATLPIWVSAARNEPFVLQVGEAEASGATVVTSWLEGMGTLSVWRTVTLNHNRTKVLHAGERQKILLDAEGLMLVDKDVLLQRDERGKHDIILRLRDMFGKTPGDPVLAAKAYALARWVITAYTDEKATDAASIAKALEIARDIPLMNEVLFINRRTHRPTIRKYGVLTVANREYILTGRVDVNSSEVSE